ncbi:hypothetical protein PCLA_02r0780 [Pseudomonas citronellolis]|nr:hypothetical protein PCLA_02r0780 [Pseudomonas citronellolis]
MLGRTHEGRSGRNQPPKHHDPHQGGSGPQLFQQNIAWKLEDYVSKIKDSGPQAISGVGQSDIILEPQVGEADIGPVDITDDVGQ